MFLLLSVSPVQALVLDQESVNQPHTFTDDLQVLELSDSADGEGLLSALVQSPRFHLFKGKDEPNFGYSESVFWLRGSIDNRTGMMRHPLLEVSFPTLDYVDFYLRDAESGEVVASYRTGDMRAFSSRPIAHHNFVFPLEIKPDQKVEFYLRVQSEGSLTVPVTLWPAERFYSQSRHDGFVLSLYFGVLIALFLYNMMIWISSGDRVYLLYILFVGAMAIGQAGWSGIGYEFLWSDSPQWANIAAVAGFNIAGMFGALFASHFLRLRSLSLVLNNLVLLCGGVFALLLLSISVAPYQFIAITTSANGFFFSVLALSAGFYSLSRGVRSARYFLIAWGILLIGVATLAARNLGWLPTNDFTRHVLLISSAIEMVLLSFALVERINELRRVQEQNERNALNAQRAVERERAQLEAANRARSEFLAMVSHEIRTPINGIMGIAQLLFERSRSIEDRSYLRSITDSGESLLALVNDFLDYSRLEAGKLELVERPIDPGSIARQVSDLMAQRAKEKGVELRLDVEEEVPKRVIGDGIRLRQILLNLVGNAVKFTQKGSVSLIVTLRSEATPGEVTLRFEVADTGIGIAGEDIERVFGLFQQGGNKGDANRYEGVGLGLAICLRLAELMGGEIDFISQDGEGSLFWFEVDLPLADAEQDLVDLDAVIEGDLDSHQPHDSTRSATGETEQAGGLVILLAEDMALNRKVAEGLLKRRGHRVVIAHNGEEAVAQAAQHDFDLILMDIRMPVIDGVEASRKIRQLHHPKRSRVPIYAYTANLREDQVEGYMVAGMNGVLPKPFVVDEFDALLQGMSGQRADSSVEDSSAPPLLDRAMISEELALLGSDKVRELVGLYRESTLAEANEFGTNIEPERDKEAEALLHKIASASFNLGLTALGQMGRDLEWALGEGRLEWVNQQLAEFYRLQQQSLQELERFIEEFDA